VHLDALSLLQNNPINLTFLFVQNFSTYFKMWYILEIKKENNFAA